jgi:hypothetical protein
MCSVFSVRFSVLIMKTARAEPFRQYLNTEYPILNTAASRPPHCVPGNRHTLKGGRRAAVGKPERCFRKCEPLFGVHLSGCPAARALSRITRAPPQHPQPLPLFGCPAARTPSRIARTPTSTTTAAVRCPPFRVSVPSLQQAQRIRGARRLRVPPGLGVRLSSAALANNRILPLARRLAPFHFPKARRSARRGGSPASRIFFCAAGMS